MSNSNHQLVKPLSMSKGCKKEGRRFSLADLAAVFVIIFALLSHALTTVLAVPAQVAWLASPFLLLAILMLSRRAPRSWWANAIYGYVAFWLFICLFSMAISGDASDLFQLGVFVFLPLACFFSGAILSTFWLERLFFGSMLILACFVALERADFYYGVDPFGVEALNWELRSLFLEPWEDPLLGRATGLLGNPNELGFVAGALGFAVCLFRSVERKIGFFPIFLSILLIVLSGSRGSILAFCVAVLFLAPHFIGGIKIRFQFIILLIVISLLVWIALGTELEEFLGQRFSLVRIIEGYGNAGGRATFWAAVFNMENLAFGTIVSPEGELGHAIDSFYMRVLAQTGVVGLAIALFFFTINLASSKKLPAGPVRRSFLALNIFVMANSITMLGYLSPAGTAIFWTTLGVCQRFARTHSMRVYLTDGRSGGP